MRGSLEGKMKPEREAAARGGRAHDELATIHGGPYAFLAGMDSAAMCTALRMR